MKNIEFPKATAEMLDKKPYYIVVAVLAFLLVVLMFSITVSKKPGVDYRNFLDDSEIEAGTYWLVDGQGLALSKQKERQQQGAIIGGGGKIFPAAESSSQGLDNATATGTQIKNKQGVLSEVYTDEHGRQFTLSADGTREYINPYSGEYIRNPDGTISYVGRDENGEFIINPDGTKTYLKTDSDGKKYVENAEGTRRYTETGEHIRAKVINPDGTITEVSRTDRGVVITNPDGTKTNILIDENGNETVIITGEPKAIPDPVQNVITNPLVSSDRGTNVQDPLMPTLNVPVGLTEEELEQLRSMKFQNYISGLQAPILGLKVSDEEAANSSLVPNGGNMLAGSPNFDTLNALASMQDPSLMGSSGYDMSGQIDKENFFNRAKQDETWIADTSRIIGHKYEVKTGTVIPGVLITSINSDLPGSMIAQVSKDVYDTASGGHMLIPQGTRIFGTFDSRIIYGQSRVLVAWTRLIFPDGSSMELPSMPGTDRIGASGFADKVNNHMVRTFGSAALMSLIVGGTAYAMNVATGDVSEDSLMAQLTANLANQIGQTSATLLEKNLSIQPTLEIRPGYQFNIVLTQDLVFENSYQPWR